mmetsp:Transcript_12427/g.35944  ORF Transcript_12427/g.35944 Transcript_12427/m.35944 type:complete len:483 (-) Transcript_12427:464-1912(-)
MAEAFATSPAPGAPAASSSAAWSPRGHGFCHTCRSRGDTYEQDLDIKCCQCHGMFVEQLHTAEACRDLHDYLAREIGPAASAPSASGGRRLAAGDQTGLSPAAHDGSAPLGDLGRFSELLTEAFEEPQAPSVGAASQAETGSGAHTGGSNAPSSTTPTDAVGAGDAASSPILTLFEALAGVSEAPEQQRPLNMPRGGTAASQNLLAQGGSIPAQPRQPGATPLSNGLSALLPLLLAASGPRAGRGGELPGLGGTGGTQIGDYAIGDISRIIDQIMATDPGSRANLPASPAVVKGLESFTIGQAHAHQSPEQDPCGVCQEEYSTGESCRRLPCGHCFHEHCILPWLESHNTCPVCRHELPTQDPEYEARQAEHDRQSNAGGVPDAPVAAPELGEASDLAPGSFPGSGGGGSGSGALPATGQTQAPTAASQQPRVVTLMEYLQGIGAEDRRGGSGPSGGEIGGEDRNSDTVSPGSAGSRREGWR